MQRLHEDDLVGHVLEQGGWHLLKFPAIAEENESFTIHTPYGTRTFTRREGEALHPEREPLEVLKRLREIQGQYNFDAQYQQNPSPLGGGMIKTRWFKPYTPAELPKEFDLKFQSWDTASKSSELCDYSAGTSWGVKDNHLYLLDVRRDRLGYPDLRRVVKHYAEFHKVDNVVIEEAGSGIALLQDLRAEGVHGLIAYKIQKDKIMRMSAVSSTIENGFVHIPEEADWLLEYLHEMAAFPQGKFDDQVDSTSQALDWFKHANHDLHDLTVFKAFSRRLETMRADQSAIVPTCPKCGCLMSQIVSGERRCPQCGEQSPIKPQPIFRPTRGIDGGIRWVRVPRR